ncbi:MAG: OmpH family outer membrane protein [Phycisphaerales bacterium]|nr:OmpH family outer membrane protein [Phycisphaerales bacterium]
MNNVERVVIFSGLAAAIALGLGWRGVGSPAIAGSATIIADGAKIGTVDVLAVVERLASSDRYTPAREQKAKSLAAPIEQINKELDTLRQEITAIPDFQNNAEAQPKIQQFQQKSQNLETLRQTAQNELESFNVAQLQEAYKIAIDTTNALAAARGYTHVFSTKPSEAKMTSTNVNGVLQEMLARPVVRTNSADDLTDAVIKELKLENVKPLSGQPAPAPAPAPASAPASAPAPADKK